MIETTVLEYLNSRLDGVSAYMEIPREVPDSFVVIEKTGEIVNDRVHRASIAFQSYSLTSLYNAASLDETVRSIMDDMPAYTDVSACRLASNYNFTDPRTKRYRYQCVYTISFV